MTFWDEMVEKTEAEIAEIESEFATATPVTRSILEKSLRWARVDRERYAMYAAEEAADRAADEDDRDGITWAADCQAAFVGE